MSAASSASSATSAASSATSTQNPFIRELSSLDKLRLLGIVTHCHGQGTDNDRDYNVGDEESDIRFSPTDASFLAGLLGTKHYVQMGQLNSSTQLTPEKLLELGKKFFLGSAPYEEYQHSPANQQGFHTLRAKALLGLCGSDYSKRIEDLEKLVSVEVDKQHTSIAKKNRDLFEYEESHGFDTANVVLRGVHCVPAYSTKWAGQRYISMPYPNRKRLEVFAQLVDELDVGVIVKLYNPDENYTSGEDGSGNLGYYKWTIVGRDRDANDPYTGVYTISTSKGDGPKKTVYQICVEKWSDARPPKDEMRASVVKSLQRADAILLKHFGGEPRPILVHCEAGIRRTGRWMMAHALFRSWKMDGNKGIENPVKVVEYFRSPQAGALPEFAGDTNGFGMAFQLAALAIEEQQKTGKVESKQEHKQQETTSGSSSAATGTTTTSSVTSSATTNSGAQETKAESKDG